MPKIYCIRIFNLEILFFSQPFFFRNKYLKEKGLVCDLLVLSFICKTAFHFASVVTRSIFFDLRESRERSIREQLESTSLFERTDGVRL